MDNNSLTGNCCVDVICTNGYDFCRTDFEPIGKAQVSNLLPVVAAAGKSLLLKM